MLAKNKKLKLSIAAFAIIVSSVIAPFCSAAEVKYGITGEGEEKLKQFLYAYGLYNCFVDANDDLMKQDVSIDDNFESILKTMGSKEVYLGAWMGTVSCSNIVKNLLGDDVKIDKKMVSSTGILYGAYLPQVANTYLLSCQYNISNDSEAYHEADYLKYNWGSGFARMLYEYAQGFVYSPDTMGSYHGKYEKGAQVAESWKLAVEYSGNGKFEGIKMTSLGIDFPKEKTSGIGYSIFNDIPYDRIYSFIQDHFTSYASANGVDIASNIELFDPYCKSLIEDGDDAYWDYDGYQKRGYFRTDKSGNDFGYLDFVYDDPEDGDCQALSIVMKTVNAKVKQAAAPKALLYQNGAAQIIAENIKKLYFVSQSPEDYFKNNPDLQYVMYGRLLFNGDKKFAGGCGGLSVPMDDPKINDVKADAAWNNSAHVKTMHAYESTSSEKKEFLTKFGAINAKMSGKDKDIKPTPWEGEIKCSELLANRFEKITLTDQDQIAKGHVYGYINPMTGTDALTTGEPPATAEPPEEPEPTVTEYNCYTQAGSLGWIVCPIIDSLKDFIQEKYAQWVAPALKIDVKLFQYDTGGSTYSAWNIFRNIANVLFVIFFVIVIFSQITGYGIDNYGIKRAFPKLLIGVILINLSFIICQVAIDVGNIAGAGIGGMFQSITKALPNYQLDSITVEGETVSSDAWTSFTSSGWNTAIVIIVGVIAVGAILSKGLAIVIPVLLALISIAIAIFGLIAILGIRQAAAVLLVVASPIALACYILPNTKSIFTKWWKAFQGLLLAYPICSALVYGGDMVSHILIRTASGNMWVIIAAAVVSIAPIFFIPKVISNCMGAISGGMMAFTNKGRNKAKGAVGKRLDNSFLTKKQKYKQQMRNQKAAARSSAYAAKRGQKVLDKYKGHEGELSAGQRRKYNAAQAAVNAQKSEAENAYGSTFEGLDEGAKRKKILEAAGYKLDKDGKIMKGTDGKAIIDPNKKLDGDMLTAGLRSMKNSAEMGEVLQAVGKTDAYKNMMNSDAGMQQRLAGVMMGSEGNAINQSIGQLMAEGKSLSSITDKNASDYDANLLKDRVTGMGSAVMASQKAEVFKMEGAADLFSDDQIREAATAGYSGDHQENFYQMMKGVSGERKGRIVSSMNAGQVGRLRVSMGADGHDHGSLGAMGGAATVRSSNMPAINAIRSREGGNIRVAQQGEAARQLGTDTPA